MTIEQAADIIQTACKKYGLPVTREAALDAARQLRVAPRPVNYQPGEIARYFRDRYEQDLEQE